MTDRVRSFQRLQWILRVGVAIAALGCARLAYERLSSARAGGRIGAPGELALFEETIDDLGPLSDEERLCVELVVSIGGRPGDAILIPIEFGVDCADYPRPHGLEFVTEKSGPYGARVVVSVRIQHPEDQTLDLHVWRENTMRTLTKLSALREISITSPSFGDVELGQLPTLESAAFEWVSIGTKDLGSRNRLRTLQLYECRLTAEGGGGLTNCRALETFQFFGNSALKSAATEQLATLPSLTTVRVHAPMSDEAFTALCASRSIKQLYYESRAPLGAACQAALEALPLTDLGLRCPGIDGDVFDHLVRIPTLRRLWLCLAEEMNDSQVAKAAELRELTELRLYNVPGSAEPPINREQCAVLRARLPHTQIEDAN